MGVTFLTFPLAKVANDPKGPPWLAEEGIEMPDPIPASRDITYTELIQVLEDLPGYVFRISQHAKGCDITVNSEEEPDHGYEAVIWLTALEKDQPLTPDGPVDIYFHRGNEEALVRIVQAISVLCGPQILYCTAGATLLIFPDSTMPGNYWE